MKTYNRNQYRADKNLVMRRIAPPIRFLSWRFYFILIVLMVLVGALVARMVYLTIFDRSFLENQGNVRILRTVNITAYRGMIVDRNGEPLAVSTPVDSIWMNPQDFPNTRQNVRDLANVLNLSLSKIQKDLKTNKDRKFIYLRRDVNPQTSSKIQQLAIPGVYQQQEFRRYYPEGEVAAHIVGFTDIDDKGKEGLELAFNDWLQGEPGKKRVIKDRYGHVVAVISKIKDAKPGNNLTLSIDNRIQFLAYRVLKETIKKFDAASGSVVVLNPNDGEILAMANQPSYNPNRRSAYGHNRFRNRAITDMFEPGSTLKAFSITSALDSGKYKPYTNVNTSPGYIKVGHDIIRDEHGDHGVMSVTEILQRSSNVGVAKMTLSLPPEHFIDLLNRVGFTERTTSGFPGESSGKLLNHIEWKPFVLATLAFGYGVSVTPLQLTQAYGILANKGKKCPVTFLKQEQEPKCEKVMDPYVAEEMLKMLETVSKKGGTGTMAHIPGYRIAGKTGTAYIAGKHGYDRHQHMSSFVGIGPLTDPKVVVSVVIKNPKGKYYGGLVAAPAFAKIMSGTLRILNVPADGK